MTVRDYQREIADLIARRMGVAVRSEWASMSGMRGHYSPRLDVAVGPFATGDLRHSTRYNDLQQRHRAFTEALHHHHCSNIRRVCGAEAESLITSLSLNSNARCFLAIEIENNVSRKHLMGGAINASALGRLGLAVGWTEGSLRAFCRMWAYLRFLSSVEKNSFNTANLMILGRDQLLSACHAIQDTHGR